MVILVAYAGSAAHGGRRMDERTKGQIWSNYWAAMEASEQLSVSEIRRGPVYDQVSAVRVMVDGERLLLIAMRDGGGCLVTEINPIAAAVLAKDLLLATKPILPDEVDIVPLPKAPDRLQ